MTRATDPAAFSSAIYDDALDWVITVVGDDSKKFCGKKLNYTDETIRRTGQNG